MKEQIKNIQHPDLINLLLQDGLENAIPKISELLINIGIQIETCRGLVFKRFDRFLSRHFRHQIDSNGHHPLVRGAFTNHKTLGSKAIIES